MKNWLRLSAFLIFFAACKKNNEAPAPTPVPTNASFSLVSSGGNCSNTRVEGSYNISKALTGDEFVIVQVNITAPGKYSVNTPVVDGINFSDSGTFTSTGIQNIILKGNGTPISGGTFDVPLTAGNSNCSFVILIYDPAQTNLPDNDNMYFGNLSDASFTTDSANNYLMRKQYYALSYSRDMGKPNWVSWHLYLPDIGATSRQNDFRPDNTLPQGWYQVQSYSYSGSGFDRGHNCPSADRTSTVTANSATYLMTNMIPQAPGLNQNTWANMEDSLRKLLGGGNELYIMMGSYGTGGTGSNGYYNTVDNGHVTVPAFVWKVAVVLPNGINDSARVTTNTRIIAVIIPNSNNVTDSWKNYRTSVDAIEAATGYNLLSRLPESLQNIIEAKVDNY